MNTSQTKAALAISRARAGLILDEPFFAALALPLEPVPTTRTETMATDGKHLYYNEAWVEKLSSSALKFIIAHEVLHCVGLHHLRRGGREPRRFNIACDYAIDPLLIEAGFAPPPDAHVDPRFTGKAPEQIYGLLPAEPPPPPNGTPAPGDGEPQAGAMAPGEVWDATGDDDAPASPAEVEEQRRDWEAATLQAAQTAKAAGKLPGFAREIAKAIRAPEIDWRDALRRYMTQVVRADYSWRRPNHRHLASDLYLPSLASESVGEIMIAVDTSGSVSSAELAAFASEINGILDDAKPERVHVVYCDAQVQGEAEYEPDDYPVVLDCPGRGGTRFSPVWDWAQEKGIDPICAIYLTDLECSDWGEAPPFPVLWVSTGRDNSATPFGEVVRLRMGGR